MTDENDTGDSAVDDPIVEMKQSELSKLMAKTRREGAERAARREPAPQTQAQTIAEIVAATVAAMRPEPEAQRPTPAAAPSAPSPYGLPTEAGLVDIFRPGVAQQLGPRGLRRELEKLWAMGDERSGKPERPTPGKKR
jgi:hypothetical protein